MKPDKTICIVKCGAATPVGTSAAMSAEMVRAEIIRLMSHPLAEDDKGNPVIMGIASYIDDTTSSSLERIEALLASALDEILQFLTKIDIKNSTIETFLGLAEETACFNKKDMDLICSMACKVFEKNNINYSSPQLLPFAHSSGLTGLEQACVKLMNGEAEFCIAGGVDSCFDPARISLLESKNRLKTPDNSFGFIPGEAAGFVLVTTIQKAKHYKLPILADIVAISTTNEENTIDKDTVCTGEGLTKAMDEVLQHISPEYQVNQIFCDLNGERYRSDEYGFAYLKNRKYFNSPDDFIAPSNHWGDIGAATAPNLINLAIEAGQKKYSKGPYNLVWTSSDAGERSALLLKLQGG